MLSRANRRDIAVGCAAAVALVALVWLLRPGIASLGQLNMVLFFLVGCRRSAWRRACRSPSASAWRTLGYLGFTTHVPLTVVVGRMDEGMSSLILLSVPIFVLLGCVLDATGMGKAIVDFLASLIGHVKAGMSYVLLGSLFIVSGISGSKVSDMATVAPALFPEMKRRGNKPPEMVALLATGAAMADTVPPSIVLIVLGSVAGVSIAGLFQSGFVVAMVLLLALLVLARWKARHEDMRRRRAARRCAVIGRLLLIAAPGAGAALPDPQRGRRRRRDRDRGVDHRRALRDARRPGAVRRHRPRKVYDMLVETAALSGAILLILGTASAMAWAITQSGVVQQLSPFLTTPARRLDRLHGRDDRRVPDARLPARRACRRWCCWRRSCSRSPRSSASTTSTTRW